MTRALRAENSLEIARPARFEDRKMLVGVGLKHVPKLASPPVMTLQNPENRPFPAEKRAANRFLVAAPQFLAADNSSHAAERRAAQRDNDRVIEPDDRRRAGPDEIADRAIVAFDDPLFARDELLDFFTKIGAARPLLSPVQAVELDVLASEALREHAGEMRLARAGASNHDNPRMVS